MKATVKPISLAGLPRTICISDIHGEAVLLRRLLNKVRYKPGTDGLILLGDLYQGGSAPRETLEDIIGLSQAPHVHVLMGNCDIPDEDWLTPDQIGWIKALPTILDAEGYTFVHAGLAKGPLDRQELRNCVKNDAFMEQGLVFDKWLITGHWPVENYCHAIPCCNPIVNEAQHIVAIDGGIVKRRGGQLNAFVIQNGSFSHDSVDSFTPFTITESQSAAGGFNITWNDRFIEVMESRGDFTRVRHLETGNTLWIATESIWRDAQGRLAGSGTDYFLPLEAGEEVRLVARYADRILAKKDGIIGWVIL